MIPPAQRPFSFAILKKGQTDRSTKCTRASRPLFASTSPSIEPTSRLYIFSSIWKFDQENVFITTLFNCLYPRWASFATIAFVLSLHFSLSAFEITTLSRALHHKIGKGGYRLFVTVIFPRGGWSNCDSGRWWFFILFFFLQDFQAMVRRLGLASMVLDERTVFTRFLFTHIALPLCWDVPFWTESRPADD